MKYSHKKNIFASILILAIMSGGCAFHSQRQTAAQSEIDETTSPANSQNAESAAVTPTQSHDDSEAVLDPPFPKLSDQAWLYSYNDSDEQSPPSTSEEDASTEDDGEADQSINDDSGDDEPDLWARIRQKFALPDQQNKRIDREVSWFTNHQDYLDRVAERAQPYLHYIVTQVEQRGMPSELTLLPVVESAFQPYAYSAGRAAGIWQFVPATGRRFGLKLNWWYDGRRDIVASTQAALDYLEYLHKTFNDDWLLALAAYNSGEGTVFKAVHYNQRHHRPIDFWSLRLPRETEQYVPRLLALRNIVATPEKLGINLKPIADEPYLTSVKIDSQLDLAMAAKLADMDVEELHQLNPGFNRFATAPDGPHLLLLPLDKAAIFATQVAELSPEDRVHWVRHRIRRGETLGGIALHYNTTTHVLRQLNHITGHFIRAGHYLIIPIENTLDHGDQTNLAEFDDGSDRTIHTVKSGDSLWLLARQYDTSVKQLCAWNKLSPHRPLRPGQQIIVSTGSSGKGNYLASLHGLSSPQEVAKPRKIVYRVRRGDSLSRISHRFKVTINQLRRWNGIKTGQYLHPGQKLTLYVALTADSERS